MEEHQVELDNTNESLSNTPHNACDQPQKRRIIKPKPCKAEKPTPLAFVINSSGQNPQHPVTIATWSEAAFHHLASLREALKNQNPRTDVPVVSLRGRLELADQNNLRLDREVGLKYRTLLWTQRDKQTCFKTIHNAVLEWLNNDVARQAHGDSAQGSIAQLKELARTRKAVEVTSRIANPYQWDMSLGKTAKAISPSSYADLADYITRHLEGKEVFPDLPGLRRIASGQLEQNQAELMTEPISSGRSDHFSIVVRIRIFSYPGRPTPLVVAEFSRRIWTSSLKDKPGIATISAYALPEGSSRAFRFTLCNTKNEDSRWSYQPDTDFAPIARRYFAGTLTMDKILKEGHRFPQCKLLVGLKHGIGERSKTKSGIPDLDKMDGFRGLVEELAKIDLTPWQGLDLIETSTRSVKDHAQYWTKRESENIPDRKKYAAWLKEAQDSIRICYAGEHHIVIAVQPEHDVETDASFAEARLTEILQGSVATMRIPISPHVHGPKNVLPGRELKKPAERADVRISEWARFIQTVKEYEPRTGRKVDGVLVIAREWYPGNLHDDSVNTRAARIALAKGLGVPVQYLRPREEFHAAEEEPKRVKSKSPAKIEQDFETRLMIAWLDLAYKSLGRVRPGKLIDEASKLFETTSLFDAYPDRILALGVVRRNKSRFLANERSFLPYAIELDTETGVCAASFAYEDAETHNLAWSDPLPLPQALVKLASLGPIQLTNQKDNRKKHLQVRTQIFFKARLADFGRRSLRPLVIIDADTSRSVWPWLQDEVIDPGNVHVAGGFNAQAAWPDARLVRIRTDNSPKVLWDGMFYGEIENTEEIVCYQAPKWAEAQLFKLNDTVGTNVYLSFGSAIRKQPMGRSCYREIPGTKMKVIGGTRKRETALMERYNDAWTTPTGLEICVVRPNGDEPDQVAGLVEWLRQCYAHFGEWTLKPAPLHFGRALKEYLADYDLEEDEGEESDEDK